MRKFTLAALMMLILSGCAPYREVYREDFNSLPHHYSQFDVKIAWKVTTSDTETVIQGVVQNVRYFEMNDIEIWASAKDAAGNETGSSVDLVIPRSLKQNEMAPFLVKLPIASKSIAKMLITYVYNANDGGMEGGGVAWRQTFETPIPPSP